MGDVINVNVRNIGRYSTSATVSYYWLNNLMHNYCNIHIVLRAHKCRSINKNEMKKKRTFSVLVEVQCFRRRPRSCTQGAFKLSFSEHWWEQPSLFYVSSRISSSWDKNETRKSKALTEQARFGNQFNSVGFILFWQRTTLQTAQSHRRKFICFIAAFVLAKNQKTNHCN